MPLLDPPIPLRSRQPHAKHRGERNIPIWYLKSKGTHLRARSLVVSVARQSQLDAGTAVIGRVRSGSEGPAADFEVFDDFVVFKGFLRASCGMIGGLGTALDGMFFS